ncbi:MAG TPA: ABC transporter ATP-binding protein [archaeon]|nr:ABC transporter ATP-binding protein [archaeon]
MAIKEKNVVELKGVYKIYCMGSEACVNALNGVDLKIKPGEFLAIMGPSGSGKSTMMHIIGALDLVSKGQVFLDGTDVSNLSEDNLAKIRGQKIGFVFQDFNLIPTLTALENVMLPMLFQENNKPLEIQEKHCKALLTLVGLGERITHRPTELSGGQQQRVAIARALANDPEIILADEPTGALDSKASEEIMDLLKDLNKKGKTIILITHDRTVAHLARRQIHLKDGKIIEDKITH